MEKVEPSDSTVTATKKAFAVLLSLGIGSVSMGCASNDNPDDVHPWGPGPKPLTLEDYLMREDDTRNPSWGNGGWPTEAYQKVWRDESGAIDDRYHDTDNVTPGTR